MEEEKPIPEFSGGIQVSGVREGEGKPSEDEGEWVSGIKLAGIIVALTTAAFLMLLDTSVVTTVSASLCVHAIILTRKAIPRITSDFHSLSDIG